MSRRGALCEPSATATEPAPRRIIQQQGRHLRKREYEHEVEEELGWRHPAVQLGVKLGHNPTLTQTRWRRETNRWIHLSHEYTLVFSPRSFWRHSRTLIWSAACQLRRVFRPAVAG